MSGSGEELRVEVVDGEVGGVAEDGLSQEGACFVSNLHRFIPARIVPVLKYLINVRERDFISAV